MDAAYLGQLIDEHSRALTLYARQWSAAPEDLVQEAFVKLSLQRKPPERVIPWLFRVVRNLGISHVRAAQRRRRHEETAALRRPSWFLSSPENAIDGATVTAALKDLPQETRETVTLHLWAGLTFAEIADVLGSSSSSVHRLYTAGLTFLRERLNVPCPQDQRKI
ncbi:MAG: sigma-70 family RNA polymerase sigma factor [Gemmataceae bacterium]